MRPLPMLVLLPLVLLLMSLGPTSADAAPADRYADSATAATNRARAGHDLRRLRTSPCLQRYAERQAARMAAQGQMFHQDLQPILRTCHLRSTGENVAYGFRSGRAAVRDGWMRSASHRANVLNAPYRLIGVGADRAADGTWYAAQVFGRAR